MNSNSTYLVKFFLDKRADINHGDAWNGWTPLIFAIDREKLENVELLLDGGADVEKKTRLGKTFLTLEKSDLGKSSKKRKKVSKKKEQQFGISKKYNFWKIYFQKKSFFFFQIPSNSHLQAGTLATLQNGVAPLPFVD